MRLLGRESERLRDIDKVSDSRDLKQGCGYEREHSIAVRAPEGLDPLTTRRCLSAKDAEKG